MTDESRPAAGSVSGGERRRGFLTRATAFVVGTVVGVVPVLAAAVTFLDPLIRSRKNNAPESGDGNATGSAGEGFLVTTTQSLPADGTPRMFPVIADLQDAWNKFPNSEIGSVYLWKSAEGEVKCFNARCPHLGCTVNYKPDQFAYVCPCHDSAFSLDGERSNEIPPRNMDPLVAEVRNDDEVWVKFRKFRAGIHEREAV